jgi:xylulokinase
MDTWATYAETVQPQPALRERYDRLYGIYEQLYPATVAQVHELAEIQRAEGLVPEGEPVPEPT